MHVERTRRLAAGETLSQVTAALAGALGLHHPIVPMADDPVRTIVRAAEGELAKRPNLGVAFAVADLRSSRGEVGTLDYTDPAEFLEGAAVG